MKPIREQAIERFWLERRLELLDILDNFAEEVFYADSVEDIIKDNDRRLEILKTNYRDVLNPSDLAETIKNIYLPHLYEDETTSKTKH